MKPVMQDCEKYFGHLTPGEVAGELTAQRERADKATKMLDDECEETLRLTNERDAAEKKAERLALALKAILDDSHCISSVLEKQAQDALKEE